MNPTQFVHIQRFPPSGPDTFFITYFEYIQATNELRGTLWGVKDDRIQLFDATGSPSNTREEISEIRYSHEDDNGLYFRFQVANAVSLRPVK